MGAFFAAEEEEEAPGLAALIAYHEKRDEKRGVGLGPNHDWASHGADAFGLLCVAYEEPKESWGSKLNYGSNPI